MVNLLIAALVCGMAVAGGVREAKADSITWVGTDFPPMAMSQGAYAHQGYLDEMYQFLKESLPQHDFREEIVPWTRAMTTVQQGGPYCMTAAFQTPERSQFLRFTEPYGYLMPIGVMVLAKEKGRFASYINKDEHVKLHELLHDMKLQIGIANGRSYGPVVDGLLRPLLGRGAAHVQKIYQDQSTKTLKTMLAAKRFDYMLGYPSEAVYYQEEGSELLFYPIEGDDPLLEGRFSCTKGAETDRVFQEVSQLVNSKKTKSSFLTAYERWLPANLIKLYRRKLATVPKW